MKVYFATGHSSQSIIDMKAERRLLSFYYIENMSGEKLEHYCRTGKCLPKKEKDG